jgi:hypothetical protein
MNAGPIEQAGDVLTVNFEPRDAATPAWMLADHGDAFGPRAGGATFGWSRDLPIEYLIERNSPYADWQGRDTLAQFTSADRWEVAVPNGNYRVFLVAGDPTQTAGRYAIDIEGASALDGVVSADARFVTSTVDVRVTDGRLTLTSGNGATANAICFTTIEALSIDSTPVVPEPGAPSVLVASDVTRTSVRLSWPADATNADELLIERSADGGATWQIVSTEAATATEWTDPSLKAGSTYYYRVRAVAGEVLSKPTNVVRAVTPAAPVADSTFDGVVLSYHEDPDKVIPVLKKLGMKSVRMWSDLEWDQRTFRLEWQYAIKYHQAGFHVTLLLQEDKVPTPQQARDYFTFALNAPGMREAVDRWEIVNEANLKQYWKGTLEQYVNNVLKPAYEVFSVGANEPVVGTGVAYDTNAVRRLVELGYLNFVDYANFHPYGYGAADHVRVLTEAVSLLSSKPIVLTEWNLSGNPRDERGWASMLDSVRGTVTANVENAYYFSFSQFYGSYPQQVWGASLFLKVGDDYVPNPTFYDLMDGWIEKSLL